MDTKDDPPPSGLVDEQPIIEEREAGADRLAELKAKLEAATPDHALPQVFSEQHV
jgi:hypothetical protein